MARSFCLSCAIKVAACGPSEGNSTVIVSQRSRTCEFVRISPRVPTRTPEPAKVSTPCAIAAFATKVPRSAARTVRISMPPCDGITQPHVFAPIVAIGGTNFLAPADRTASSRFRRARPDAPGPPHSRIPGGSGRALATPWHASLRKRTARRLASAWPGRRSGFVKGRRWVARAASVGVCQSPLSRASTPPHVHGRGGDRQCPLTDTNSCL
jgi:hypothetical protein